MNSHFGHRTLKLATACALALGFTLAADNSQAATATADATAIVVSPIGITENGGNTTLIFGKFVAGSGGTVVVSPAGVRTKTGGVVLLTGAGGLAAAFNVAGDNNATYAITLPPGNITITSGANTMTVNTFTSTPSATGALGGGGSEALTVGGTLTVANAQAPGSYTGTFDVAVEYN